MKGKAWPTRGVAEARGESDRGRKWGSGSSSPNLSALGKSAVAVRDSEQIGVQGVVGYPTLVC